MEDEKVIPIRQAGWLTTGEAALLLGVDPRYMKRLRQLNALRATRVGHMLLWREKDVLAYRESHPRVGQNRTRLSA